MKISFLDDEPEIYPLQYGGKARTITNLAKEFAKISEVEKVTILSKSIKSNEKEFSIDGVNYIVLDDSNIIARIEREMMETDILNIHCCSFTFPIIQGRAKKFYFLHDVLIATADKGSHLDKALGGQFNAIISPSKFAKSIYDDNKKIINGKTECYVIPRHINENVFYHVDKSIIEKDDKISQLLKNIIIKYKYIIFFPNRPIEEKGGKYLIKLSKELDKKLKDYCIIGPFEENDDLPSNFINTGWIKTEELKYYYSISNVTLNLSILPESFSQVCIESIICGTPVVSFKSGNIPYLNGLTNNIILVEKDAKSILSGIDKAFDIKEDKIQTQQAQEIIRKEFDVKKIINMYMKLYKKYLEE